MHRVCCSLLLTALALFAMGQAADPPPAPAYGFVAVRVLYDDGLPCVQTVSAVIYTRNGGTNYLPGIPKGEMTVAVQAGAGRVVLEGQTQPFEVRGGETVRVTFTTARPGVVLDVRHANGDPVDAEVCYGQARTDKLGPGRFWTLSSTRDLPNVPAYVAVKAGGITRAAHYAITADPGNPRQATITVPAPGRLRLRLMGADGQPRQNADATVSASFPTLLENDRWNWRDAEPPPSAAVVRWAARTDADGYLPMREMPGGEYAITAYVGDQASRPLALRIEGETAAGVTMALGPRDVSQIVYALDGAPVAGAEMHAVYSWRGEATILHATADAAGMVVWRNLPPTRVITWGPRVPAGVIQPEATRITAPLPAPEAESLTGEPQSLARLVIANPGDAQGRLSCRGLYQDEDRAVRADFRPGQLAAIDLMVLRGTRVLRLVSAWTPTGRRLAVLDAFWPYADDLAPAPDGGASAVRVPVTLHDMPILRGRFSAPGMPAVPGVSRLGIVPVDVPTLGLFAHDLQALRELGLLQPVMQADGGFSVAVPAPGEYRLHVDLFDDAVPAPDSLRVAVGDDDPPRTIALPAPLLNLTTGTTVNWLPAATPTQSRSLTLATHAAVMPVFGPTEGLLAIWYNAMRERLVLWDGATKTSRILPVREVQATSAAGVIAGLPQEGYLAGLIPSEITSFAKKNGYKASIAVGRYAYRTDAGWKVLTVPANGRTSLALPKPLFDERDREQGDMLLMLVPEAIPDNSRYGAPHLVLVDADLAGHLKAGSRQICITFDAPYPAQCVAAKDRGARLVVPGGATRMTVAWPGIGAVRDLPIPRKAAGNTEIRITRPARWEQGAALELTVLKPDGTPFANGRLRAWGPGWDRDDELELRTDAAGKVTLTGVNGLTLSMAVDTPDVLNPHRERRPGACGVWQVTAPADGADAVILRMAGTLARFADHTGWSTPHTGRSFWAWCRPPAALVHAPEWTVIGPTNLWDHDAWWLPDGGAPVRLVHHGDGWDDDLWMLSGVADTPGALWIGNGPRARLLHLPIPCLELGDDVQQPAQPSLGIVLPFVEGKAGPGMVTLAGEGALAGFTARVAPRWWPSPELGIFVAQLGAIPAGPYRLTVETPRGPIEVRVTVTADGGSVRLAYP